MNSLLNKTLHAGGVLSFRQLRKEKGPNPSKLRERRKSKVREKHINKCDPAYTGEGAVPNWDEKKGKVLYKFMNQFININRISRNIPEKEKKEFIEKEKEYNLYLLDKFRKRNAYEKTLLEHQNDILKSASFLPDDLKLEVKEKAIVYYSKQGPNDHIPKQEIEKRRYRFSADHLYLEQKLRVIPDESRMIESIIRNSYRDEPDNSIPEGIKLAYEETNKLKKL